MGVRKVGGRRRVVRKPTQTVKAAAEALSLESFGGLLTAVRQFRAIKKQANFLAERESDLKTVISAYVEEHGDEDDKGSIILELPEEVDGVTKLKREKRVGSHLNEDNAEKILKAKKLYKRCTKTEIVLDQEEIMAAFYDDELTEEDIDAMFTENITWAFKLLEN